MCENCPNCGRTHHHAVKLKTEGGLFGDGATLRCRDCGEEYERNLSA